MAGKKITKVSPAKVEAHTESHILTIIEEAIQIILTVPDEFHFSYILAKKGLFKATLHDWDQRSPLVKQRHQQLRELSEMKLSSELSKKNSQANIIGGIFNLKCNFGYVEEQHKMKQASELPMDTTIEVGFDEDQD